ncbi:VOC family protein [Flagellimonas meridianipacifica]|uniref:Catechol 2,3-dioxygenase-like lactoylglutathione lyase family enzyme n=1 Tax=Flagellimonas meridianipacifica TaxID=1080225 RepID=A0A2T0MCI2_9FLAO|nr:VOC family protein [Allomuricauda pacifica]PRX55201.1 catechol 2,3-dioxygenase-like lactoylglutathione lyase family enzyme [Allomuricauda pacifica]
MKKYGLLCIFCMALSIHGQENYLSFFDGLIGKTWKAEGNWGDGSKFSQEITFEYVLDGTLVIAKSKGFTDKEQTKFGNRNHGIRKYNPETKAIEFWEFDVFGGLTKGTVTTENRNIVYSYRYGESIVTDMWEYIDENTYNFKVGNYVDGYWKQVYLSTQFIAEPIQKEPFEFDHQSLVVTQLMKTGDFYRDVFGFEEIPHPERKPGFRWFKMYGNSQLHLIKKDVVEFKKDKSIHLCLATEDLESFIEKLMGKQITFYDWPGNLNSVTHRADGVKQIYIQDPEGYWIEINDAQH